MDWTAALPGIVGTLAGGVLLLLLPKLSGSLTPFGVNVPERRASDPAIRVAIGFYYMGVGSATVIALGWALILAAVDRKWMVPVSMAVLSGIAALSYSLARHQLIRAKRLGHWYRGVAVGLSAGATNQTRTTGPLWIGHLASFAITISSAFLGLVLYPKLPDRLATHWSSLNAPDGFAQTSVISAFTFVIAALAIAVVCAGIAWALKYAPVQNRYSTDAETAERYGSAQLNAGQMFLATISFGLALSLATLNSFRWSIPGGNFPIGVPIGMVAATLLTSGGLSLLRYRRSVASPPLKASGVSERLDSPDDYGHWAGGLIYMNRDNKSILVPKRVGVGWTINAGTPIGALILTALIALIAVALTLTVGNILK